MTDTSICRALFFSLSMAMVACEDGKRSIPPAIPGDTTTIRRPVHDSIIKKQEPGTITNLTTQPDSIVAFAKTLIGIPYLYASTDPKKGFDCSGFITYVFNHFDLAVPRSSVDFTHMGREIDIGKAKPGDLILFTGTDSTIRIVGHMGIVESVSEDQLHFIHSTSGKGKGVVITPFENYYRSRFVKVIRVFPDERYP